MFVKQLEYCTWINYYLSVSVQTIYNLKEYVYDPVTNYIYIEGSQVSVLIKRTNANKCTLSEIFLSEILKWFSTFKTGKPGFSGRSKRLLTIFACWLQQFKSRVRLEPKIGACAVQNNKTTENNDTL